MEIKNNLLKYLPHSINEIPGSNEEVSTEGNNILESVSAALALISDRIYVRVLDAKRLNRLLKVKRNDQKIKKGITVGSFEISDDVGGDCSSGGGCGCSSGGVDEKDFQSKLKHYKEKCISLIDELKQLLDENSHVVDVIANHKEETPIDNAHFRLNVSAAPFNPTPAAAPFNSTAAAAAAAPRFNPLTFNFNPRPWYHQVHPTPNQPGGSRPAISNHMNRPYFGMEQQPVFVPGNQGMFKTRLCTYWQQTGACPNGEQCIFAHGFNELRPYILHPRYRTEVCRTVRAGIYCPYGHRCQFRHH